MQQEFVIASNAMVGRNESEINAEFNVLRNARDNNAQVLVVMNTLAMMLDKISTRPNIET